MKDVSDLVNCLFICKVMVTTAAMRSRNFLDAAQAEKMREREAMENVKLLYHDNMIEMTAVSIEWTPSWCNIEHCHVLHKITLSFVTLSSNSLYHHININSPLMVVVRPFIIISLFKHEIIFDFSLVG